MVDNYQIGLGHVPQSPRIPGSDVSMSTMLGIFDAEVQIPLKDSSKTIQLTWASRTDVGHIRKVNEDSLVSGFPIFAVCDGMGGHAAGDIASGLVVKQLNKLVGSDSLTPQQIYQQLIYAENEIDSLGGEASISGAGTTVTGISLMMEDGNPFWFVFNIGDSRVYRLYDDEFDQITIDHSLVQEMVDSGYLHPDEAEGHPESNVITRAIGFNADPLPDGWKIPAMEGERYLICSDGLTKEIGAMEIARTLKQAKTPADAASRLVHQALSNAGRDNVTVIVVETRSISEAP